MVSLRIIVLGATGMLGHKLWQHLSTRFPNTFATTRKNLDSYRSEGLVNRSRIIDSIDAEDFAVLRGVMRSVKPDFILNCIGITKRRAEADSPSRTIVLNSLFPHRLVEWGKNNSARVINFSTDCVFNGLQGYYDENSTPNATDLYGKTKALGEIQGENALTLRSSFIGTELENGSELLEWFLSQKGTVKGFAKAIYSGLTVIELCRVVERILVHHPTTNGLYNISSDPITKFDLLMLIRKKLLLDVEVIPYENEFCDRSLNSTKFRNEFKYSPPTWEAMIEELHEDLKKKL